MPRDQRDPQLLGEMLLQVRQQIPNWDLAGVADEFNLLVPDFDATHQGPLEKYGDPRAK